MAHFTSTQSLSMVHAGYHFVGAAGTVFWIPDSMVTAFKEDPGPIIAGLTWVDEVDPVDGATIADNSIDADAKVIDETVGTDLIGPTTADRIASQISDFSIGRASSGDLVLGTSRDDPTGRNAALPYWTVWRSSGSGTADIGLGTGYPSARRVNLHPAATGSVSSNNVALTTDLFVILPACSIRMDTLREVTVPAGVTLNFRKSVLFYNHSGTYISSADFDTSSVGPASASLGLSGTSAQMAPANARYARLEVIIWETVAHDAGTVFRVGAMFPTPGYNGYGEFVGVVNTAMHFLDGGDGTGTEGGYWVGDTSGTASRGLNFANDFQMWRSAADTLETQAALKGGGLIMGGIATPAQLTAHTADWNVGTLTAIQAIIIASNGAYNLYGLLPTGVVDGQRIWLYNSSAYLIAIPHEHASAAAANRWYCPNDANISLRTHGSLYVVRYGSRWHVLGA